MIIFTLVAAALSYYITRHAYQNVNQYDDNRYYNYAIGNTDTPQNDPPQKPINK